MKFEVLLKSILNISMACTLSATTHAGVGDVGNINRAGDVGNVPKATGDVGNLPKASGDVGNLPKDGGDVGNLQGVGDVGNLPKDGGDVGNGGDAVFCTLPSGKTKIETFDLDEARNKYHLRPQLIAGNTDTKVKDLIRRITVLDPARAQKYTQWYSTFKAELDLSPGFLPDLPDSGIGSYGAGCIQAELKQFAIQRTPDDFNTRYTISAAIWSNPNLTADSQAALIMHELIYREAHNEFGYQDSQRVRWFNALVMSNSLANMSQQQYLKTLIKVGFTRYTLADGLTVVLGKDPQWVDTHIVDGKVINYSYKSPQYTFATKSLGQVTLVNTDVTIGEDKSFLVTGSFASTEKQFSLYRKNKYLKGKALFSANGKLKSLWVVSESDWDGRPEVTQQVIEKYSQDGRLITYFENDHLDIQGAIGKVTLDQVPVVVKLDKNQNPLELIPLAKEFKIYHSNGDWLPGKMTFQNEKMSCEVSAELDLKPGGFGNWGRIISSLRIVLQPIPQSINGSSDGARRPYTAPILFLCEIKTAGEILKKSVFSLATQNINALIASELNDDYRGSEREPIFDATIDFSTVKEVR